jgi:outer membrane cobalamin receptor
MFFFPHVLATLLAFASPSPAPTATPVPEIAHVYTSDRIDETLKNTARTTYVVTREQITRNGYRTIAQALADVPALVISPLGPIGSNVNYTLRGSASSQVLVLVDGLPAPGSLSNSVLLGNLPTTGVERIEVVEGGGSTLYGTGAIGGVINIITQRKSEASALLRWGSFADKQLELNTPNVQFTRIVANNAFGLPNGATRSDVDYQSTSLHANEAWRIGAFDAAVRAGVEADNLGAPGPNSFLSLSSRESNLNENANLTLTHKTAQSEATLQIGGTKQHIFFSCDQVNDANCFTGPALSTESRVDLGARNAVRGTNAVFVYGVDLSRGVVRSDSGGFATPPVSVNALAQAAAYVQERLDTRWGNAYAGLRAERDGGLGGEISPSVGGVLRFSNVASLKVNAATAFRAPNASELYFPGYGNPSLTAERAKVADATFVDSHIMGGASLGWFMNRTNNLIVPEPVSAPGPQCTIDASSFTFQPCNVDHAFIEGLTLSVRTLPYNGITAALNVTDLYRAQDVDAQTRLPNDPVIAANLRLDYTMRNVHSLVDSLGVSMRLAGDRGFVDRTALFDQPAAFTSVDAYARLRASENLLVTLRGYNLGNERYAAVAGFPLPGRSFIIELSTK